MPMVRSTGLEIRFAFDEMQSFRQRHSFKQAEPIARVPVPGQVKTIPADVVQAVQARKRRFEFRIAV
jgi:hypothetical protein